ncbi:MAG: glycosyltransferase [Vicinamibacterales bacterium]
MISVIVPSHNHGHVLRDALSSIVPPFTCAVEIVVVDDGCTDLTSDVVATFDTPCELRFVRQRHAGLAAARNRGLRESRGRYVLFLYPGDRLAPGALETGAAMLDQHPEAAFVFGRCVMVDADGTLLPTPSQARIVRDQYRELLRRNYISVPAVVMFKREAVERAGGFNPSVNTAAGYELYLHVARHYPVCDHAQVVVHHRRPDVNASGNASHLLRDTLAVLRAERRFLEGDEASLLACAEGLRTWTKFYGTRLCNEILMDVSSGAWMAAAKKSMVLARRDPKALWHQATRHKIPRLGRAGGDLAR